MRKSGWLIGMLLGLLAITGQAAWTAVSSTPVPTPQPTAAPSGSQVAQATATPTAAGSPATYKVGETVTVEENGAPKLKVTISDVKSVSSYKGKILTDVPDKGKVFIQAKVTYEAVADHVYYGPFDFVLTCAGQKITSIPMVLNGPTPKIEGGYLAAGEKFAGWDIYEVPTKGEVRLGYRGENFAGPVEFETVIRPA